jgi:hypothetical protein
MTPLLKKTVTCLFATCALALAGCSTVQNESNLQSETGPNASAEALLDRMVGKWVLRGTIAGKETTHDIEAAWVLNREYMRLHEASRELSATGKPAYEAIVFISWDQRSGEYACLWLDSTTGGGLSAPGIAHGKRSGDTIPLVFNFTGGGTFHTTFIYDRHTGTWKWVMDDETGGNLQPFARVTLTKK